MSESYKSILYKKVWNARESCCGDSPKTTQTVIDLVREALNFASVNYPDEVIIGKLRTAIGILEQSKSYYDSLPADQVLCDILNHDLGD